MNKICMYLSAAFAVLMFFLLFFFSCDILRDGIFEVDSWTPGEGFHDPVPGEVSLSFTLEPDKLSVERSFSLNEEGKTLDGSFHWEGPVLHFVPSAPLEKNKDYLLSLGTGACDTKGLSLERRFESSFSTRPKSSRPLLLESFPANGGILQGGLETITLVFSEVMERSSFSALSFNPSVQGVWSLENGGASAVFTPSAEWINGKNYRLILGESLSSGRGLTLGRTETIHFSAGRDYQKPVLEAAYALEKGNRVLCLEEGGETVNSGWERSWDLELVFSEEIAVPSALLAFSTEPSLDAELSLPGDYGDALVFHFKSPPPWGTSFSINTGDSFKDRAGNSAERSARFYVKADGPLSRPPSLAGIRMPLDVSASQTQVFRPEDLLNVFHIEDTAFPFDTGMPFWIELYFEAASQVNAFSLMEHFRFSTTNNALSFSPREVRLSSFSLDGAAPGLERLFRAEVRGVLTNRPYAGVLSIGTGAGLEDSLGNKSVKASVFLLLK